MTGIDAAILNLRGLFMKAASKIFRIFVVGMAIMSSLLVSLPVKAETTEPFSGYWFAWEEWDANHDGTYQNVIILTNDPMATGTIRVTNQSSGRYNFDRNLHFSGTNTTYTHLDLQQSGSVWSSVTTMYTNMGSFGYSDIGVTGSADNVEVTALSSDTITALANAIGQSASSYDDTQLLQAIAGLNTLINSINNNVITINGNVSDIETALGNIYTVIQSLSSLLSNIDSMIDTISWINLFDGVFSYSSTYNGEYVNTTNSTIGTDIYFDSQLSTESRRYPSIVKYTLPLDGSGISNTSYFIDKVEVTRISDGVVRSTIDNFYVIYNRTSITLFVYNFRVFDPNDVVRLHLHFTSAVRSYRNSLRVDYIDSNDIEYWSLLNIFEQERYFNSQNSELDKPNEDLSDSVDDYVQTEDSLIEGFDNAITENSVDPTQLPNSNPGNWGTGFTGSLGLIGHVFNMLTASATGGNAVYLLMNFSLMLGLALLIIGKRG